MSAVGSRKDRSDVRASRCLNTARLPSRSRRDWPPPVGRSGRPLNPSTGGGARDCGCAPNGAYALGDGGGARGYWGGGQKVHGLPEVGQVATAQTSCEDVMHCRCALIGRVGNRSRRSQRRRHHRLGGAELVIRGGLLGIRLIGTAPPKSPTDAEANPACDQHIRDRVGVIMGRRSVTPSLWVQVNRRLDVDAAWR